MSTSKSSSNTSTKTSDRRVAGDNGAIGISSEGDAHLTVTAGEAWELGAQALESLAAAADASLKIVGSSQDVLGKALDTQTTANKSEAGQIGEQIVKIAIPTVALAAVAYGALKK